MKLTATVDGEEHDLQLFIVEAGAVADIDLELETYAAAAGERVSFSAVAYDRFDNVIEDAELALLRTLQICSSQQMILSVISQGYI